MARNLFPDSFCHGNLLCSRLYFVYCRWLLFRWVCGQEPPRSSSCKRYWTSDYQLCKKGRSAKVAFASDEIPRSVEWPRSVARVHAKFDRRLVVGHEHYPPYTSDSDPQSKSGHRWQIHHLHSHSAKCTVPSRQMAATKPTKVLITAKFSDSVPTNVGDWDR